MEISELDPGHCIYRCTKCGHEHRVLASLQKRGVCHAGRGMDDDGCQSTDFVQGNYWLSDGSCYHFCEVKKGQSWAVVKAAVDKANGRRPGRRDW